MYICYADESGYTGAVLDPNQRFLVMAAILANTYNMHRTQADFGEIVEQFRALTGRHFREVKAEELYAGRNVWQSVAGGARHTAYEKVLLWFAQRSHHVLFSAIDTRPFFQRLDDGDTFISTLRAPYIAAALQIALVVQRRNQNHKGNKGRTLIIFDEQGEFDIHISELIAYPPPWTDEYYEYCRGDRLDQIIDTAYFVRSHHASLIQVADLVALVLRRYAALLDGGDAERYTGESDRIRSWVDIITPRLIELRHRLPPSNDALVAVYKDLCPNSLKSLRAA